MLKLEIISFTATTDKPALMIAVQYGHVHTYIHIHICIVFAIFANFILF